MIFFMSDSLSHVVVKAGIARHLGHCDTPMTERHYAHLAPNYVADRNLVIVEGQG